MCGSEPCDQCSRGNMVIVDEDGETIVYACDTCGMIEVIEDYAELLYWIDGREEDRE